MKKTLLLIFIIAWPYFLNDVWLMLLPSDALALLWGIDIVTFTIIPVFSIYYLVQHNQLELTDLGLKRPLKQLWFVQGVLFCLFTIVIFRWKLEPFIYSNLPNYKFFIGYNFPEGQALKLILIIYAALSAGILEEVIFRGILISHLQKHNIHTVLIILISCSIFSLIHWGQGLPKLASTFVYGIIPAIWYIKSKQLWGPITAHCLYDYLIFANYI